MLPVEAVVAYGLGHAVLEAGHRLPPRHALDLADVRHEVARLLRGALRRKGCELPAPASRHAHYCLRELAEAGRAAIAHVEDLAVRLLGGRAADHRFHCVLHVDEVAQERAVAEHLDGLVVEGAPHEPVGHPEAAVLHLSALAVDVGETQGDRSDAVVLVIDLEELLGGEARQLVDAARTDGMILRHRQHHRPPVFTPGASVDGPGPLLAAPEVSSSTADPLMLMSMSGKGSCRLST